MTRIYDTLDDRARGLISRHLALVIEANETLNLTRIQDPDEGMLLHVEDSLTGLEELNAAPMGLYADLGSGAGFPGIPLAIASGRQTLLVDARQKKMLAVERMIEELGMHDSIQVFAGRAELLARSRAGEFSVVTARALSKIPVLLELANPLLACGGHLICYKAHVDDDEMKDALRVQKLVGMSLVSDRGFSLEGYERRILAFAKVGKGKVRLPRAEGMAQKKPL